MRRGVLAVLCITFLTGCLSYHRGALPGEPEEDSYTTVRDVRVRYDDVGEGPAVVMIHGFSASKDTWDAIVPVLAEKHRVITLDLKGFGWTERPPGDYSPQEQAKLVLALLDELGVERTAVVAHSWGSSVALALTLEAPERVRRVALYDAWVYEEQLPTTFVWSRAPFFGEMLFGMFYRERPEDKIELAFYDKRYVTQELVDKIERDLARPGTVAAALAAVRGQRFDEMQERYATIEQPVLLLWGAQDVVTRVEVGYRLHAELPNARLQIYEQCGHFPMIEAYHASTRELASFLAQDLEEKPKASNAPEHVEPQPAAATPAREADVPADEPESGPQGVGE